MKTQETFTYGLNTNIPPSTKNPQNGYNLANNSRSTDDYAKQLQGCTFTRDQYEKILKMLGHNSNSNGSTCANAANMAGKAFLVSEDSTLWIIDTGETNHMVSKLEYCLKIQLYSLKIPS